MGICLLLLWIGLFGSSFSLSFNSEPNQALYSNVNVSAIVTTSLSSGSWTINWLFGTDIVANVQIDLSNGNTIRTVITSTPYKNRLSVSEFPTSAMVYTSYNTTLTINNVTTSDTFPIKAEAAGNPSSITISLSVKECNDTYQGLTPSNNANYMGTATFKCIGPNTVSVLGTCQADATWSISGTCPLVQCNTTAATDSANGIILTNSALLNTLVNVSDTVSVECDVGFTGVSGTRTCQADETWSASITCAEVFCNTSTVVSNGICLSSSVTPNSNVIVDSVVSLTCCVGYIPNNGSGTCANDGSWNTALVCTPVPTTPECSWCLWLLWLLLLPIFGGVGLIVWKMGYCEKQ